MLISEAFDTSLTTGGQPIRTLNVELTSVEIGRILQGQGIIELSTGSAEIFQIRVIKNDDQTT